MTSCKSLNAITIQSWCPGEDSNLHELLHWYLKPARLPVPPPGQGCGAYNRGAGIYAPAESLSIRRLISLSARAIIGVLRLRVGRCRRRLSCKSPFDDHAERFAGAPSGSTYDDTTKRTCRADRDRHHSAHSARSAARHVRRPLHDMVRREFDVAHHRHGRSRRDGVRAAFRVGRNGARDRQSGGRRLHGAARGAGADARRSADGSNPRPVRLGRLAPRHRHRHRDVRGLRILESRSVRRDARAGDRACPKPQAWCW